MEEGGGTSLPGTTKKPTIIRSNTSQGAPSIPVRPAPPVPGSRHNGLGERPPPPKVPNRPESDKKVNGAPEKPQRPMSMNVTNVPTKPLQRSGGSVRLPTKQTGPTTGKKPEITILSAKPMSEVGFRDVKGDKSPNTERKQTFDEKNMPPIPPRTDLPEPLIPLPSSNNILPSVPPRKEPPCNLPLPPVPPRKDLPDLVISSQNSSTLNTNGKARPPLPVNRPAASTNSVKCDIVKSESLPSEERPRPRPRVLPSKDSKEEQQVTIQNKESLKNVNTQIESESKSDIQLQEVPSGPPKPKRPTIIRVDKSHKSFTSSSQINSEENNGESSQTFNDKVNKPICEIEKNSLVNGEESKMSKPPPLAPKPKPKPKLNSQSDKSVVLGASDWASKVDSFNSLGGNKKPNIIRPPPKPKRVMVDNETACSNKGNIAADEKGDNSDINKPNISHITVAEGCDYAQVNKARKAVKEVPKDDMNICNDSRPPPPVPKKRPSSICNIPQALKEEEIQSARNLDSLTVDKFSNPELNITRGESPNTKRKPVPRMRPMSLAATSSDRGQGILPNVGRPPPPKKYSPAGGDRTSPVDTELKTEDIPSLMPSKVQKPPPPRPTKSPHSSDKTKTSILSKPPPTRPVNSPQSTENDVKEFADPSIQEKLGPLPSVPQRPENEPTRPPPVRPDTDLLGPTTECPVTKPSRTPPGRPEIEPHRQPPGRPSAEPTRPSPGRPDAVPIRPPPGIPDAESTRPPPGRPDAVPIRPPPGIPDAESTRPPAVKPTIPPQGSGIEKSEKPPKPQSPRLGKLSKPPTPKTVTTELPVLPSRPGPGHPLYHYMMNVPHCIAEFDYQAREVDELSFQAGTCIILMKRIDGFWLLGKHGDKEGMFPEEFVQIVVPLQEDIQNMAMGTESNVQENVDDTDSCAKPDLIGHGPRCRARFDFEGEGHEDLNFEEGDYIQLLERIGDEWVKGKFNGKVGIFPLSFVEVIEDLPVDNKSEYLPVEDSPRRGNTVTALYDFQSDEHTDLNFQEGDRILVLSRINDEWLYGQVNGHSGQFPQSFIDEIPADLAPFVLSNPHTDLEVMEPKEPELGTCTALYDFEGSSPDDLVFSEGEMITIISQVDADWLSGRIGNREGIFPMNFVQIND